MMLVSHVLFGSSPRYWKLLPVIYMANRLLRPSFVMRVYCAKDATKTPGFQLLERLANLDGAVQLKILDQPYRDCEPTLWRLKPFWEEGDIACFLCRDLDSIPSSSEIRAERVFLSSRFLVHGMKTHPHHAMDFMAGLCGFKAGSLAMKEGYVFRSYEEFAKLGEPYEYRHWVDQGVLRDWCSQWRSETLITVMNGAPGPSGPHPILGSFSELPESVYSGTRMEDLPPEMLSLCDEFSIFPGAQLKCSKEHGKVIYGRYDLAIGTMVDPGLLLERVLTFGRQCGQYLASAVRGLEPSFGMP